MGILILTYIVSIILFFGKILIVSNSNTHIYGYLLSIISKVG